MHLHPLNQSTLFAAGISTAANALLHNKVVKTPSKASLVAACIGEFGAVFFGAKMLAITLTYAVAKFAHPSQKKSNIHFISALAIGTLSTIPCLLLKYTVNILATTILSDLSSDESEKPLTLKQMAKMTFISEISIIVTCLASIYIPIQGISTILSQANRSINIQAAKI